MLLKSESNENTPWKVPILPSHNSYVGHFAQDDDILDKIPINILSPGNYSAHNHHPCGTGRADKIMIITIITIVKGTQWPRGNPNHWQIFPHNKENTRPHKEGGLPNPTTLRQFSHFRLVIGFWVVIKLVILMMSETSQITGIWWCKFTDISNLQIL